MTDWVKKDRPMKTLRFLAAAGDAGLLTTEIVARSGEPVNQTTLTRYGTVLRRAVDAGHVTRGDKSPGAWQQPPIQRWHITPAGRQHILEVQHLEAHKTVETRKLVRDIRKRQLAVKEAKRLYIPGTSPRHVREQAVMKMRDAGATWAEISRVVQVTEPTARADYQRGTRQWPSPLYPNVRAVPFGPDSARLDEIAGILAGQSGLTHTQVAGLISVMWALGMRIVIPDRFRVEPPEDSDA